MAMKKDAKFEVELTCQFIIDIWGIWQILTRALENLKNLHFNRLLLTKVYNVWAKKMYRGDRGVMFDGTEYWWKIWRKTDFCFLKIFVYRLKYSNFILESKMAELNWKQNFWFILKIARMFPILTSKNRLMNTFIIVFPYRQSTDRDLNILLNG